MSFPSTRRLACFALASLASASGPARGQPVPRFERAACAFEGAADLRSNVECGTLTVREDRSKPEGRVLGIAVAILKATRPGALPDPVVYLSGGPGAAALGEASGWQDQPLRTRRDLILVDQRGTGLSRALCPAAAEDLLRIFARDLSVEEDAAANRELALRCRQSLREAGVDPDLYDSQATAADLEDLRRTLGVERWNLLGVSYGTRLALAAMRDFPGGIRSAVLDSAYPPGEDLYSAPSLERSLEWLAVDCAASPECRDSGDDVRADFAALDAQLARQPATLALDDVPGVPGGKFVVNSQDLRFLVDHYASFGVGRSVLPALLRSWRSGRLGSMATLWKALALKTDLGKYYAIQCREALPFSKAFGPGAAPRGPARAFVDAVAPACEAWQAGAPDPRIDAPVQSAIPTLLLAGSIDSRAPRAWAARAAAHLPNARLVDLPGAGHGALLNGGACAGTLLAAFLEHPEAAPDDSCARLLAAEPPLGAVHPTTGPRRLLLAVRHGPGSLFVFLGLVLLVLATALLVWPVRGALRLLRRRPAAPRTVTVGFLSLGLAAALALVFAVGLTLATGRLVTGPFALALVAGLPASDGHLFLASWAMALLVPVGAAGAALGWRGPGWARGERVHFALVLAAGVAFVCFLLAFDLF